MSYPVSHARLVAGRCAALILALAATSAASQAFAACSCTGLTLSHTNNQSVTICSNRDLHFAECRQADGSQQNGCAGSTYAYTCPVGVNPGAHLEQKTGFATDATLTGNANDCRSGQALQLTITSNRGVVKPKVHATPRGNVAVGNYTVTINSNVQDDVPDVGTTHQNRPLYGADSYTDPNDPHLLIQRTVDHLKWWDNTDQTKDDAGEAATWQYRFFSYVTGTAGQHSCGCVFDIAVDWPANGAAVTTYTSDAQSSTNCHF